VRKLYLLPLAALILTIFVLALAAYSEQEWKAERPPEDITFRETLGLPSIALGTNYGATRNPLLEVYCTSLYDMPGGYCYIYSASFLGTPLKDPVFRAAIPGFNLTAQKS